MVVVRVDAGLEREQDVGLDAAAQAGRDYETVADLRRGRQDAFFERFGVQLLAVVEVDRVMGDEYGL